MNSNNEKENQNTETANTETEKVQTESAEQIISDDDIIQEEIDTNAPIYNLEDQEEDYYYVPTLFDRIKDWIMGHIIPTFIIVGIIIVGLIVFFIPRLSSGSNPIKTFVESSADLVYKGGFDFDVSVTYDGEQYLKYDGSAEFDQTTQEIYASYAGVYPEYSYENYTYTGQDKKVYFGNYYKDKWTIIEDTHMVTDFYDFLRDYKEGRFDANAYISFYSKTGEFVPTELNTAVNKTLRKLGAGSSSILHAEKTSSGGNTVYTFKPELDKVFEIVKDNFVSAYSSATKYEEFKEKIDLNMENLKDAELTLTFTVDEGGTMTEFHSDLNTHGKNFKIDMLFSNIGKPSVKIPEEFFEECGIDTKDVEEKYLDVEESLSPEDTKKEETEIASSAETESAESTDVSEE